MQPVAAGADSEYNIVSLIEWTIRVSLADLIRGTSLQADAVDSFLCKVSR